MCLLNHSGKMFSNRTMINPIVNSTPRICPKISKNRLSLLRIISQEMLGYKQSDIFNQFRRINDLNIVSKTDDKSSDACHVTDHCLENPSVALLSEILLGQRVLLQ